MTKPEWRHNNLKACARMIPYSKTLMEEAKKTIKKEMPRGTPGGAEQ